MTALRIEKLARQHPVDEFDCGSEALNRYLIRFAVANQLANAAQTWIGLADDAIVGYYTLAVGSITYAEAPVRLTRGLARHPVPVMILARLATDHRWQGRGVGAGLLKNAMLRTLQAADIAGIRALVVHAKDQSARAFYEHFDFEPSPTDPLHLWVLLKDLRHAARET